MNARLAGMEGEQRKEEDEVLDVAKRRLQVCPSSVKPFYPRVTTSSTEVQVPALLGL